jgi:hypothetical protein
MIATADAAVNDGRFRHAAALFRQTLRERAAT